MMKILLPVFFTFASFTLPIMSEAAWTAPSVKAKMKKAKSNLLQRKRGFDAYLKKKQKREARRLAEASKMKAIRKAYAKKREKARKNFTRKTEAFPREAYVAFLKMREKRRNQLIEARRDYVSVQDELRKVFENKKYKINGNREFDL